MKKSVLCVLLAFCLLLCCSMPATAASTCAEYVFLQDSEGYLFEKTEGELTFWEAPNVLTGQTQSGGILTIKNETDRTVDFTLESVTLPYDNTAALTYLDSVTLVIEQDGTEIYHDAFTRLMDANRAPIVLNNVGPGESGTLQFKVSCAFTYTGNLPSYESMIWTFKPSLEPKQTVPTAPPPTPKAVVDWMMVVKIAGTMLVALLLTCIIVIVLRIYARRRGKHGE